MPPPPSTFTKSKWLAFFAELTSKVTHHNITVVIEGCECIKRLLLSRISVGAFLEEGSLLQHMLDAVISCVRCEKPPTRLDGEMLHALVQNLSLIVDLMASLHADGDEYYSLLVVSRAGIVVDGLTQVLQGRNRTYFGYVCTMLSILLTLPLTVPRPPLAICDGVAAVRHVRGLEDALVRNAMYVQQLVDTSATLAAVSQGAVPAACAAIAALARGSSGTLVVRASTGSTAGSTTTEPMVQAPQNLSEVDSLVRRAYGVAGQATCHDDVLLALNDLWCLRLVHAEVVALASGVAEVESFVRFLRVAPRNSSDSVLFRSVLLWCAALLTSAHPIPPATHAMLIAVAAESLAPMLAPPMALEGASYGGSGSGLGVRYTPGRGSASGQAAVNSSGYGSPVSASPIAVMNKSSNSSIANTSSSMSVNGAACGGGLGKASTPLAVIAFLVIVEQSCAHTDAFLPLVQAGLFAHLARAISAVQDVTSVLVDAPSTVDGTLPDELYLACAMRHARDEAVTVAVVALKLLAGIAQRRGEAVCARFGSEMQALMLVVVPAALHIVVNNPTMQASATGVSVSLLHHTPCCTRACRATTLGECAAVCLDALLAVDADALPSEIATRLLAAIPAVLRVTRESIQPHLRGLGYRIVMRLCTTCTDLVAVIREMPSIVPTSVATLLKFTASSPQWEAAAAAEWLHHVLAIAAADRSLDEDCQIGQTVLPTQLLQLAATHDAAYPTSAFALLLSSVAEQQRRLQDRGFTIPLTLAPHGLKSLPEWNVLLTAVASSNQALATATPRLSTMHTAVKDAISRATSAFEELALHFCFCAGVMRALRQLLIAMPEFRDSLDFALLASVVTSAVAAPTAADLGEAVSRRFGINVSHPAVLQRTYEEMLVWTFEVIPVWLHGSSAATFGALSSEFFEGCCSVMSTSAVSQVARTSIAAGLGCILELSHQRALLASLEPHGDAIFYALVNVQESTVVAAAVARLIALYPRANAAACATGYIASCAQRLREAATSLRLTKTFNAMEFEQFSVVLSLVASGLSHGECQTQPSEVVFLVASSLLVFSCAPQTRSSALQALRTLAASPEGRRVLLCDVPTEVDAANHSCFGKLVALSFGGGSGGGAASSAAPSLVRPNADVVAGTDAISTAVACGRDAFVAAIVKLKVMDTVESALVTLDRQRLPPAPSVLRFLASATLCGEAQTLVARRPALLTLLCEWASGRSSSSGHSNNNNGVPGGSTQLGPEQVTLALLTLRNLCFNHSCKMQLCQDSRVLQAFRSALLAGSEGVTQSSRQFSKDATGVLEVSRRQKLAATALWALVHNNQRGKTYVRALLMQPTANGRGKPLSLVALNIDSHIVQAFQSLELCSANE